MSGDHGVKEMVARFVEKIGFESIILHEQPSLNRTIIEKLEANSEVEYAVVLLTPDDRGGKRCESYDQQSFRARQNVIFELGLFLGKIGRAKVCVLHERDVEILSDYQGVIWVELDSAGAWRTTLAKEMKAAGLPVEMDRL
jgi:predicted nucleotide-binding protein